MTCSLQEPRDQEDREGFCSNFTLWHLIHFNTIKHQLEYLRNRPETTQGQLRKKLQMNMRACERARTHTRPRASTPPRGCHPCRQSLRHGGLRARVPGTPSTRNRGSARLPGDSGPAPSSPLTPGLRRADRERPGPARQVPNKGRGAPERAVPGGPGQGQRGRRGRGTRRAARGPGEKGLRRHAPAPLRGHPPPSRDRVRREPLPPRAPRVTLRPASPPRPRISLSSQSFLSRRSPLNSFQTTPPCVLHLV